MILVVVTGVSSLVHLYSVGYMHEDPYRPRFFSYLSFFTFAMLMLVTANNFLQMFFGWEGVGLASYLLIGFWFTKPSANAAAMKAFIVNRVGDFGFALGVFGLYAVFGTLDFDRIFAAAPMMAGKSFVFAGQNVDILTTLCILLFIGAMGKSAQLFLHTWLPDAMEGPTPVSALIHAATMVTAGVFLVCRCSPLFELAPIAREVVTVIGASTAFFAASVGLFQNDIKRVIAYSTCSQLGYMFFAAGVSAYNAAMFHLFTHAFFKALLFLGAGSVIHAMHHEQDMRHMGGLMKKIPLTYTVMLIGTIAITGLGVPFTSIGAAGFYSKDAILEAAFNAHTAVGMYAFTLGRVAAAMTSFYSWRLMFMTFAGKFHGGHHDHAQRPCMTTTIHEVHESPGMMLIPLIVLSIGALFAGAAFAPFFIGEGAMKFWMGALALAPYAETVVPTWVTLAPLRHRRSWVFAIAYYYYVLHPELPPRMAARGGLLYKFLYNKWYFDEFYDFLFVRPAKKLGRISVEGGRRHDYRRAGPGRHLCPRARRHPRRGAAPDRLHLSLCLRDADRCGRARHLVPVFPGRCVMAPSGIPILSLLTFIPALGALAILLVRGDEHQTAKAARLIALVTTLIDLVLSLVLWANFNNASSGFQFVESAAWLGGGINYKMGVDGISMLFVVLTAFLMPLCILASQSIHVRVREYMIAFLFLETLMIGVFCALDLVVFYVFFEGGLIPMFLIIGVWGGPRRVYATFKFFLFTLLGSVLMLLAIMAIYWQTGTSDIAVLLDGTHRIPAAMQPWLWFAFFASFAVKLPMWPVHTWLPDAHVAAPPAGSVIRAATRRKSGGSGFLRYSLPMFPIASETFAPLVFTLSLNAIVYTSLVALAQEDMKKLIAYSSVAHMGLVSLGTFTFSHEGIDGAIFQMLSHGVVSAALFLCVGVIYDRMHTRLISAYGGLVNRMPVYAACFMVFTLANVGLPGTSGFVGEFLTLLASFRFNTWLAIVGTTGVILSAAYALWLYRRIIFGALDKPSLKDIMDLNTREIAILAPLVILTVFFGVYPKPIFDVTRASVAHLVELHDAGLAAAKAELAMNAPADIATIMPEADRRARRHGAAHARRLRGRRRAAAGCLSRGRFSS